MDISLNIQFPEAKFYTVVHDIALEISESQNFDLGLKPIFHQNAKYLASGVGVGQCTRRQNFALPNAKYTNMLISLALGDAHFSRFTRRVLSDAFYPTPVSGI